MLSMGYVQVGRGGVAGRDRGLVVPRRERSGGGKISTFEAIEVVLPMRVWYWDRRRCGQTGISSPRRRY